MKCFSLTLNHYHIEYANQIISLLQRMINLEELSLFLLALRINETYIDGSQLHDDILIYKPELKKFIFSINTAVIMEGNQIQLQSDEDIQNSFIERRYEQVGSYAFHHRMDNVAHCHVYSLPYQFEHFFNLNNSFHFQHGICDKVRRLTMNDRRPFEHEFFKLTACYFPSLEVLIIYNYQPQQEEIRSSTPIVFPRLILLDLLTTHEGYAEQFLLAKNTRLPCLLDLHITVEALTLLTINFKTDPAHLNCTQIRKLLTNTTPIVRPETFHKFFPFV